MRYSAFVLLIFCASPSATAQPPSPTSFPFDLEYVAPDTWAAIVRRDVSSYAFSNSLVVVGADGVLVVDTQQSPNASRALIARIRELTDRPVRWVVNTHWHGDHVWGNVAYREAFPDVQIFAHASTGDSISAAGGRHIEIQREQVKASIARFRQRASGELADDDRARIDRGLAARQSYLTELDQLEVVPPDQIVAEELELDLGNRRVVLVHVGPAHTPGDVIAWLPAIGVVAVGDLVEDGPLWLDGADVDGWIRAIERLRALSPRVVLPSHGGIGGPEALDAAARYLTDGPHEPGGR